MTLLASAGSATLARAQRNVEQDCTGPIVHADLATAWKSLNPDSVYGRLAARPLSFGTVGESLVAYATELARSAGASGPSPQLLVQLDTLRLQLRQDAAAGGDGATTSAVQPGRFGSIVDDDGSLRYFVGFAPSPLTIAGTASEGTARPLCWPIRLARRVAERATTKERLVAVTELKAMRHKWEAFKEHGQSMLPHELLVNDFLRSAFGKTVGGWFGHDDAGDLSPPGWQLVLLHPSVGIEIRPIAVQGARTSEAMALEWGGVRVYGSSRAWHVGASYFTSFAARSDFGSADGLILAASPIGWFGITRFTPPGGKESYGGVLSIDAYRLLDRWKEYGTEQQAKVAAKLTACQTLEPKTACIGKGP